MRTFIVTTQHTVYGKKTPIVKVELRTAENLKAVRALVREELTAFQKANSKRVPANSLEIVQVRRAATPVDGGVVEQASA